VPPQGLEGLLVLERQLVAEGDEVAAADVEVATLLDGLGVARVCGRLEVGVVGQARVAAHPVVVLDPAFGG
jgi:hypothetical protein